MKKKSKLILILIFIINIFFILNSVSAVDTTIDNKTSGIKGALSDGYDTIYLEPGTYSGVNNTNIKIDSKNVTIIGRDAGNVIIDAKYNSRAFEISQQYSLILINISIINGPSSYLYSEGSIILSHGKLNITNSSFKNGGIDWGKGGAIYINSTGTGEITNSKFENMISGSGGVIYFHYRSSGNITNTTFINNNANLEWGSGGAVYYDSQTSGNIINCTFMNNKAGANGGSVYINDQSIVNIKNVFFNNNSGGYGGAVFINSQTSDINNSTFTENFARLGGAIYVNKGSVTLINSIFNKNEAVTNGGAIFINENGYGNIIQNNFTNNIASYGGAIFINGASSPGNALIKSNIFRDNIVNSSGGAVYINHYAYAEIDNSDFINNTAPSGGAIFVNENSLLKLYNSNLLNNNANNGGSLYINRINALAEVNNTNFKNNLASQRGGGIFIHDDSSIQINNSYFINNSAEFGGAIHNNQKGIANINNSYFISNNASYGGGVNNENILKINRSRFDDNKGIDGSAIMNNQGNLEFDNNIFFNNVAENGRTVPFKYGGDIVGNLFNNMDMSGNQYINNIEQFNTTLRIISVEIINKHIVVQVRAYDTYNQVFPEGRLINFIFNGISGSNLTDSNGIATFHYRPYETNTYNITTILNTTVYNYDNERWNNRTYYVYKFSSDNSSIYYIIYITKLQVTIGPAKIGENANITAKLTDEKGNPLPYQKITFSLNGVVIGSGNTDHNGRIVLRPYISKAGMFTVNAFFDGEGTKYEPSEGFAYTTVKSNPTNLVVAIGKGIVGETVKITAKLTDEKGNPLANQKITFTKDGDIIGTGTTDKNGKTTITYKISKPENMTIYAKFNGEKTPYESSTAKASTEFKKHRTKLSIVIEDGFVGETVNIIGKLTDEKGNPLANQKIAFIKDGKTIGFGYTDKNGRVIVTYKISKPENITIYAKFNGEKTPYESSTAKTTAEFLEKNKEKESNDNNSQYPINTANMKSTGIPIIMITLILISVLGSYVYKKK